MHVENKYNIISLVTPSYNQGEFITDTIESVLRQTGIFYIDYIIMDGNSSDNSIEIIKKYETILEDNCDTIKLKGLLYFTDKKSNAFSIHCKGISYRWISESDFGQTHALNKGFNMAVGGLFGWINSDDYLAPNGIENILKLREKESSAVAWVGACHKIHKNGNPKRKVLPRIGMKSDISDWSYKAWFSQPSCFFDPAAYRKVEGLDEKLHFALDVDLWMRLAEIGKFSSTNDVISFPREYPEIKTWRDPPMKQAEHIYIDIKNGMPEKAREKMVLYENISIETMPYMRLIKSVIRIGVKKVIRKLKRIVLHKR